MSRTVLVTGANGFIGRHACAALARLPDMRVTSATRETSNRELARLLGDADAVVHLAGVNRPNDPAEFSHVNAGFTRLICDVLAAAGSKALLILVSSTQAGNGTPYGDSKLEAERIVEVYAHGGGSAAIFRFPNVFGKWARPRYNSVVATFAHAIATGEPYEIHDAGRSLTLLHVGDAVSAIARCVVTPPAAGQAVHLEASPTHTLSLGALADLLMSFRNQRTTLRLPEVSDAFVRVLYSTYLSYLPTSEFAYDLVARTDNRGTLAEFVKSPSMGQIFVSRTYPGITRGNHWHETKVEKFLVMEGEAIIRFRSIAGDTCLEYPVSGSSFRVIDIPPGYAHSIENVGSGELVTLFWASEPFDPDRPDTYAAEVVRDR